MWRRISGGMRRRREVEEEEEEEPVVSLDIFLLLLLLLPNTVILESLDLLRSFLGQEGSFACCKYVCTSKEKVSGHNHYSKARGPSTFIYIFFLKKKATLGPVIRVPPSPFSLLFVSRTPWPFFFLLFLSRA